MGAPELDAFIGQVIADRYELRQLLGQGAMGRVYRAHHVQLKKPVCVKLLLYKEGRMEERNRRFRAEARAASQIDHPGVVRIHDFGEYDGTPYIAMELIEGEDLQAFLEREGALAPEDAFSIMIDVLAVLAAAHARDIVHRDVKPANVLLSSRVGDDGESVRVVKVCDFGLAKLLNADLATGGPITQKGSIFGTPAYMSPEQARGDALDARSDIYSSGVLLYRMMSGQTPFKSDSAWGVLQKHMEEPAAPLSSDGLIAPRFARVVERALEKAPDRRFQSARDMRAAMVAALEVGTEPKTELDMTAVDQAPTAEIEDPDYRKRGPAPPSATMLLRTLSPEESEALRSGSQPPASMSQLPTDAPSGTAWRAAVPGFIALALALALVIYAYLRSRGEL